MEEGYSNKICLAYTQLASKCPMDYFLIVFLNNDKSGSWDQIFGYLSCHLLFKDWQSIIWDVISYFQSTMWKYISRKEESLFKLHGWNFRAFVSLLCLTSLKLLNTPILSNNTPPGDKLCRFQSRICFQMFKKKLFSK